MTISSGLGSVVTLLLNQTYQDTAQDCFRATEKEFTKPGMVGHTCNPSYLEVEIGMIEV
jgi:hypothetical protein